MSISGESPLPQEATQMSQPLPEMDIFRSSDKEYHKLPEGAPTVHSNDEVSSKVAAELDKLFKHEPIARNNAGLTTAANVLLLVGGAAAVSQIVYACTEKPTAVVQASKDTPTASPTEVVTTAAPATKEPVFFVTKTPAPTEAATATPTIKPTENQISGTQNVSGPTAEVTQISTVNVSPVTPKPSPADYKGNPTQIAGQGGEKNIDGTSTTTSITATATPALKQTETPVATIAPVGTPILPEVTPVENNKELVNKLYETPDKTKQEKFLNNLGDPSKYQIEVGLGGGVSYKPYPGEIFFPLNTQGSPEFGVRMSGIVASKPYAVETDATWLGETFKVSTYMLDIAVPVRDTNGVFTKDNSGKYEWKIVRVATWMEDSANSKPKPLNALNIAEVDGKSIWNDDFYNLPKNNNSPTTLNKGNSVDYSDIRDKGLNFFEPGKIAAFSLTYLDYPINDLSKNMNKKYLEGNETEKRIALVRSFLQGKFQNMPIPNPSLFQSTANHDGKSNRYVNIQQDNMVLGLSSNFLQFKSSSVNIGSK